MKDKREKEKREGERKGNLREKKSKDLNEMRRKSLKPYIFKSSKSLKIE